MKNKTLSRQTDGTSTQDQAPFANYESKTDDLSSVFLVDQDTLKKELSKTQIQPEDKIKAFVDSKSTEEARELLGVVNKMMAKEESEGSLADDLEALDEKDGTPEPSPNALSEEDLEGDNPSEEAPLEEESSEEGEETPVEEEPAEETPPEPEKELQSYNIGRLIIYFEDVGIVEDIRMSFEEASIPDTAFNYSSPSYAMEKGPHKFHRFLLNPSKIMVESREQLEDMLDDLFSELGVYYREGYIKLKSEGPFRDEMDVLIKKIK